MATLEDLKEEMNYIWDRILEASGNDPHTAFYVAQQKAQLAAYLSSSVDEEQAFKRMEGFLNNVREKLKKKSEEATEYIAYFEAKHGKENADTLRAHFANGVSDFEVGEAAKFVDMVKKAHGKRVAKALADKH